MRMRAAGQAGSKAAQTRTSGSTPMLIKMLAPRRGRIEECCLLKRDHRTADAESGLGEHRRILGEPASREKKGEPIQHEVQCQHDQKEAEPQ